MQYRFTIYEIRDYHGEFDILNFKLLLSRSFPLSFVVFVYFIQFVLEYSGIISIDTFEGFTLFAYHSLGTDFHQVSQWRLDKVEKLLNSICCGNNVCHSCEACARESG